MSRYTLLIGVLCALLVAPVRALQERQELRFDDVDVTLETLWPDSVTKGYQPLVVTIANNSDSDELVEFELRENRDDWFLIEHQVVAPARQTTRFDLPVPVDFPASQNFMVEVSCKGDAQITNGAFGGGNSDMFTHEVVVLSGESLPLARLATWSEALSPDLSSRPVLGRAIGRWRNLGLGSGTMWEEEASVNVSALRFDAVPRDWRYLTAFDFVVVDLDAQAPSDALLLTLLAWVRQGGEVLFTGPEANAQVSALAPLAPYLRDRFALQLDGVEELTQAFQCGAGRLFVQPASGLLSHRDVHDLILRELQLEVRTEWTPSPRGSRLGALSMAPLIPGAGILPYRTFVVFIILFGILIWPVNFYFIKRREKPVLLLVTVPLIAFGASVLVLLYGVFGQGISTRVMSESVAVLDQRLGTVSVAEARATYSGWAPGRGLVPMPGTAVLSLEARRYNYRNNELHRISLVDGEERYGAAYLPSRVQVRQALLSDRSSRLRLEWSADGEVSNGLSVAVEELLVRGFDGAWYYAPEGVAAGAALKLTRSAQRPETVDLEELRFDVSDGSPLPPGTYAARLAGPVFVDWGGLDVEELDGEHGLLGILEEVR